MKSIANDQARGESRIAATTKLSRRSLLKRAAALAAVISSPLDPVSALSADAEPRKAQPLGLVIHSYAIRQGDPQHRFADPLQFLEHARSLGAAGVQTSIGQRDDAYIEKLRQWLKQNAMYLEGIIGLPRDAKDVERFAAEIRTASDCGVTTVRTVMLSGRRYETFDSATAFRRFAQESFDRLILSKPVVERFGVRLAIENHKDWRAQELVDILERANSPRLGVCLDTGNSVALLEEPHEVVEQLAPLAFTTHFKDMAVREYDDGYQLSEVPLGTGMLDLPRVVRMLRAKQPEIHLILEMITRDPLKVPCLTAKYWATFETLSGRYLASMIKLVRQRGWREPLPEISNLPRDQQLRAEDDNIAKCLEFARLHLAEQSG
jgi:3-oxoisoapionate decarboxylase